MVPDLDDRPALRGFLADGAPSLADALANEPTTGAFNAVVHSVQLHDHCDEAHRARAVEAAQALSGRGDGQVLKGVTWLIERLGELEGLDLPVEQRLQRQALHELVEHCIGAGGALTHVCTRALRRQVETGAEGYAVLVPQLVRASAPNEETFVSIVAEVASAIKARLEACADAKERARLVGGCAALTSGAT